MSQIGSNFFTVKIGNVPVSKIYIGTNQVYPITYLVSESNDFIVDENDNKIVDYNE